MNKNLIKIIDEKVKIGNINVEELVNTYQTPLICYDQNLIEEKIQLVKKYFVSDKFDCQILYASKAFSIKAIYQLINKYDLGIDVVSGGEIFTAISSGFNLSKAFFHGNNKSLEELKMALDNNIGCIVIDNYDEVNLLKQLLVEHNKKVKVLIRLNPGVQAHTHDYIQTAKLTSKFGISIYNSQNVIKLIEKIKSIEQLDFKGFHFHIGSQIFDDTAHIKASKVVIDFMKVLKDKYQIETSWLNIGGGFGIKISEDDQPYDLKLMLPNLVKEIQNYLDENNLKIEKLFIEPGRSLVSEAGASIYRIGGIKDTYFSKKYLFIDGGMHENIRPALYQAKYDCDNISKINSPKEEVYSIAGKNCESGDVLIEDAFLPKCSIGDLLIIYSTGAYTYSMASNYNKNTRPAVIFIKNGKSELVVRRESFDDLITNEIDLKECLI